MVDAGLQILSLANQLQYDNKSVSLLFSEGMRGAMGYLNRIGFFDYLHPDIEVLPERPSKTRYFGNNSELVEIASINPEGGNDEIPDRLANAIQCLLVDRDDSKRVGNSGFTIFGELIDNIEQHSSTVLNGYAALQLYHESGILKVTVSDSGEGIMDTIRPVLEVEYPDLQNHSDAKLFLEMIKRGISRHGSERGCGLKTSAGMALRYNATVDVRMPTSRAYLNSSGGKYIINKQESVENLSLIRGTHICFDFRLDT